MNRAAKLLFFVPGRRAVSRADEVGKTTCAATVASNDKIRFLKMRLGAILLSVLITLPLFSQQTSGNLTGVVYDAAGGAVAAATVIATNAATSESFTTTSTSAGIYRISNLPPATYSLKVQAPGFSETQLENVVVPLNQTVTMNVTVNVHSTTTTIEVVAAATTIDTTTSQIQTTFSTKQTTDLPSVSTGSGVLNLSLLSAGVSTAGTVGVGTGPSVGGQRPRNNNFTLEGVDNNNKSVTGPLVTVPNDDVAEFTVLQNQFSPEYGHSTGGQFNIVVKGGSNQYHGMLYEYNRNRNYNAVDNLLSLQGTTSNPRYDNNRLGANFGGPILKNKLFFFTGFEYNPVGQSSTPGLIYAPTAAGYSALSGLSGLSANNLSALQQYLGTAPSAVAASQLPNAAYPVVGGATVESGILPVVAPNYQNNYSGVLAVDYTISDSDQLRGRFIYNRADIIDTFAQLPVFYVPQPFRYYLGNLSEFHNFSPSISNEFRLGFNRYFNPTPDGGSKFPGLSTFPNLTIDEYQVNIGPDPNAPQETIINTYQLTDNLTWTHGAHTFKFGFNGQRFISPQSFTQRVRGDYEWSTLEGYLTDSVPDVFAERTAGNTTYYGNQWILGAYGNDDWKITPHLTLNLGVRWEEQTIPTSATTQSLNAVSNVPGLITFGVPTSQRLNFAPRIGFAYSPGTSGATSIRGGFGEAFDTLFDNLDILSLPPQLQQTNDVGNPGLVVPNPFLAGGGLPDTPVTLDPITARNTTGGYIPNQTQPKSYTWTLGVQHVFAQDYTLEVRYVGTRGLHLPVQDRINNFSPVTASSSLPTFFSAPSQSTLDALPITLSGLQATGHTLPQFLNAGFTSNITSYEPIGNSTYHALDLQLNRRFAKGLQFIGAYTWSHNIDDSTAEVFSTVTTPRRPQDFGNFAADRSNSALDHRHRATLSIVYDLPFFKQSSWMLKNIVGNWEVAPIYTYQVGNWQTSQSTIDSNLNGDAFGDRTVINPHATTRGTGSGVTPLTNSAGETVGYLADNPAAQYVQAGLGVLPTNGRNTLQAPAINDIDITALKRISVTERFKVEFQAQALNLFNHPQYVGGYLNDVSGVGNYTSTDIRQYLNPASSSFNRPDQVYSSNPRQLIFVAKFIF
ncbi:MAG TPA: TonB-dependent receptor [Bryobacteraceae bacterium]|jgi:hypothetical protein|nr:TonB-dependent receptor [Bryobacteraceae bacterium]